jgi:periplasmic protein TonB
MSRSNESGYLLLLPAAGLAIVVVFGLLFLMQALINADQQEPEQAEVFAIGDIWQEEPEITEFKKEMKLNEVDEAELPPDLPQVEISMDNNVDMGGLSGEALEIDLQVDAGAFSDGDVIALVRVNPEYPQRAAERGIEGFCTVYFTITALGTTRDAYVPEGEESCSNSLFQRPSLRAIERFKFKPKIVDGDAVEIEHANRFIYELED